LEREISKASTKVAQLCLASYGLWLVLICCERKVLLTAWWLMLIWCDKKNNIGWLADKLAKKSE
jgi:hypothetical protein